MKKGKENAVLLQVTNYTCKTSHERLTAMIFMDGNTTLIFASTLTTGFDFL